MKQFEYKKIESLSQMSMEHLKLQGELGWEMCGIIQLPNGYSNFTYFFKKEIEEDGNT